MIKYSHDFFIYLLKRRVITRINRLEQTMIIRVIKFRIFNTKKRSKIIAKFEI